MDEPTSALDPISTSKIEELVLELKKKYTVVIVTHNMQQAVRISDKTAFFLLGDLVEYGQTDQIFSVPKDKRTENYMENLAAEKKAEEGETASDKMPPFMARITDVCGMLSLACGRQDQELYLQIKDPIIRKNNGYFQWKISGEQSTAVKLSGKPEYVDLELTIGELASMIFEGFHICLTEVV